MRNAVLVVEDDPSTRSQLKWALRDYCDVYEAWDGESALNMVRAYSPDVIILDLRLPPKPDSPEVGMDLIGELLEHNDLVKVLVMTGSSERDLALEAMRRGAFDFFFKPFDLFEMRVVVKRALHLVNLERRNRQLQVELESRYSYEGLVGKSRAMQGVFHLISRAAESDATVLICGESGTGKELVARAIHYRSPRKDKPFVVVDCAALNDNLLENELFGHERGAFTGAVQRAPGQLEVADGGTVFLDEVGDMSPRLQMRLLRFIQEREFRRLGGSDFVSVDVRIIAATQYPLQSIMEEGKFRRDLYYRLSVVTITIPPLRERPEDIPLLVERFLAGSGLTISPSALDFLISYTWPGNVRELENRIERAKVVCNNSITLEAMGLPEADRGELLLERIKEDATSAHVRRVLLKNRGDIPQSARDLGIRRESLYRLLRRLDIDPRIYRPTQNDPL
ncbi:MAG: sigma-54-dependent transcriptional regulator [bacterium]